VEIVNIDTKFFFLFFFNFFIIGIANYVEITTADKNETKEKEIFLTALFEI
jgi:hypothetical protein